MSLSIINIVFGIVSFSFLMIVVPMIIGGVVCKNSNIVIRDSIAYRFLVGFFCELGLWAIMVLPFSLYKSASPFHEIRYAYLAVIMIVCLIGLSHEIWKKKTLSFKDAISDVVARIRILTSVRANKIYVIVYIALLLFQLFETMYYAPVGYVNDDLYYYNHINDTVYMDQLYPRTADGAIPEAANASIIYTTGYKLIVNQWFSFISFLSATTGIHTLILCRTLIPAYIIVILYVTMYSFGLFIFPDNITKRLCYLMCAAIIIEILSYSYYLFFLILYISTYGKQIAGIVGVPLLLLTVFMCTDGRKGNRRNNYYSILLMILVSFGVASFGVSALSSGAVALVFFSGVLIAKIRDKKTVCYVIAAFLPFVVQFAVFLSIGGRSIVVLSPQ